MRRFTTEPMTTILAWLQEQLTQAEAGSVVAFEVLDPDAAENAYAGTEVVIGGEGFRYRGYKAYSDLAELLFCRLMTPERVSAHTVALRFKKLDVLDSFHTDTEAGKAEKYGVGSRFFGIDKSEEPAFLSAYLRALDAVKIKTRGSVLNLGINGGDEFETIRRHVGDEAFAAMRLTGIDHSDSAIAYAGARFTAGNVALHVHDINTLERLGLERYDLLMSIGTLQSPGINFNERLMWLVQNCLSASGAIILGFPNCRWMGGEMIYGAKAPNYSYSEMSLLYKDVAFCRKYLQQHKFRVTLTGKQYVFLTATKIGR